MLIINKLIPNSVEGSSDDLDMPIKKVLSDVPFSGKHRLLSLNSINWGRIMMQTVHFVYSYFFAAAKTACEALTKALAALTSVIAAASAASAEAKAVFASAKALSLVAASIFAKVKLVSADFA